MFVFFDCSVVGAALSQSVAQLRKPPGAPASPRAVVSAPGAAAPVCMYTVSPRQTVFLIASAADTAAEARLGFDDDDGDEDSERDVFVDVDNDDDGDNDGERDGVVDVAKGRAVSARLCTCNPPRREPCCSFRVRATVRLANRRSIIEDECDYQIHTFLFADEDAQLAVLTCLVWIDTVRA
jgi:hypothetical protein